MTRAWLQKELRDHGWALFAWALLAALIFGLNLISTGMDQARGSWLETVRTFTLAWSALGVTYLAGRLIRREYANRTQLFLESLPVSRARVLTTKLLLGAGLNALLILVAIAIATAFAWRTQAPSVAVLASVTARALSTVWAMWALVSMAALLGRYRTPLLVLLGLALVAVAQSTSVELGNLGPARLLGADFAFASASFPWAALGLTWAFIAVFVGIAYALLLARDGTLTVQLSDRMSHREKVYVTCVILAVLVAIGTLSSAKKAEPYRLEDATVAERDGARVEISADVEPELGDALAHQLVSALADAKRDLGLEEVPTLAVLPTQELDPNETQRASVANARGVVLRAALWDERLDRSRLTTVAIHDVVSEAHDDRVMDEPLHALLDAYANLAGELHVRGEPARELLWIRATLAHPEGLARFLVRWDVAQEQLGSCVSGAAAATVLLTVEELAGKEAAQKLVRRVLDREGSRSWYVSDVPFETLLREETGLSLQALEERWHRRIEETRKAHRRELEPVESARVSLELAALSGKTYELRHSLSITPAPAAPLRYSLRYQELGPIDVPQGEQDFEVQQALVNGDTVTVPRALVGGTRWMWVVDLVWEPLGCELRLSSERREIP